MWLEMIGCNLVKSLESAELFMYAYVRFRDSRLWLMTASPQRREIHRTILI